MVKIANFRLFILTLYIVFYLLYPKIYLFNYIILFLTVIYFVLSIYRIKEYKNIFFYLIPIIAFYFIPAIYYNSLYSAIINFADFIVRISPILIGLNEMKYYSELSNIKKYISIKKIIIILVVFISIINIYYLNNNPYFARIMANYSYNVPGISFWGTISGGGYFAVYGFVFLICYLFNSVFIEPNENKKSRMINIILLVIAILFMIKANFATAFVMMITSILLLILTENINKKSPISILLIIMVILSVIHYKDLANVAIKNLPQGSIISIRLKDAINNNGDSTTFERFELMKKSVNTIKTNFVFGISAEHNYNYNNMSSIAGLHTEWLDFFVKYGVFLSIEYYLFIYKSFRCIIKSQKNKRLFISLFISAVLLGCFNPILNGGCFLMVFLIIPIMSLGEKNEKNI